MADRMEAKRTGGKSAEQLAAERHFDPAAAEQRRAAAVRQQLDTQAKQYRSGMAMRQDQMMTGQGEEIRRGLADQISGIRQNANSRGLLYSGLGQAAQQEARSGASAQLQAARARINEHTNAQADAYDKMALEGSLENQDRIMQQAQSRQAEADAAYDVALRKRMSQKSAWEKGAEAVGQVVGFAAGQGK
jgi:hypothetical protein